MQNYDISNKFKQLTDINKQVNNPIWILNNFSFENRFQTKLTNNCEILSWN